MHTIMWKPQKHYQAQRFSNPGRGRRIKTIPTNVLLNVIAQSKQTKPTQVMPEMSPTATHSFSDFPLDPTLQQNIRAKGFTLPTPIQLQVIPAILAHRDVIGTANTGTGKTAAFLIPLIQKIILDRAQRVLVVTPTRELAYQIYKEVWEFSRGLSVRSAILTGGASEWRQMQDMKRDPSVVIATPGRLKEFIETNRIRLSGFRNVVLDEADRMVDIGFINDITYFISLLPAARQSLFFSATISGRVAEVMAKFVTNPIRIAVAQQDIAGTIVQDVVRVSRSQTKLDVLYELLQKKEFEKVLVFGRTKHGVQKISDDLTRRGIKSGAIHGNKRQNQRQYVLQQFARSEIQILLATDVASRGLDIPNVSHVINYDMPETIEDYTHRIGRTGRANKQGVALTFID